MKEEGEIGAIARLKALLAEKDDPRLRYLLGRLLVAVAKEVEGSLELEAALSEVEAEKGGLEEVLAELDDLLSFEEDEPDLGGDP